MGERSFGCCFCGCGKRTNIARADDERYGRVKGEPNAFVKGHQGRRHGPGIPPGILALYDPEDEPLVMSRSWYLHNGGYLAAGGKYKKADFLHRAIMGDPDDFQVDHINGNRLDNRRCNLRIVSAKENSQNITVVRAKTGYRNVYFQAGGYFVTITCDGKQHYLGRFPTAETAHNVASAWRVKNMPGAVA